MRRRSLDRLAAESTAALEAPDRAQQGQSVPCLTIAWHPDVDRIGERVALLELAAGAVVELSRLTPRFASADSEPYPLADRCLSRRPVRLAPGRAAGSLRLDAEGSGLELKVDGDALAAPIEIGSERLRRGVTLLLSGRVVLILHASSKLGPPRTPDYGLVGKSDGLRRVRSEIARVAELDMPVLLRGATGTGKELVAEAIHRQSARRDGPLLAVNLAAVPPSLAAAELFGAAKGAYTGAAAATPGYFRRAAGGTLLLDEIGDISADLQALLLRVLETGEIQPVGGGRPVPSDVRLVAATDADLEAAVAEGSFRAPLLHRLASYTVRLPALANRREDVGLLLRHFLRRELDALGRAERLEPPADDTALPWLRATLVARLARHDWPGNVRELRNVARHLAVACSDREQVPAPAIGELLAAPTRTRSEARDGEAPRAARKPADVDEAELIEALRAERWRPKAAARRLGIPRPSIYHLMRRSSQVTIAAHLGSEQVEPALRRHGGDFAAAADELEVSERALRRRVRELGLV